MNQISVFLIAFILLACQSKPDPVVSLHLPDDLEATLWAESPMFFNPTNMDVDEKGRVWITEAVNYRNFNNDSLRFLHQSKGDRVVILEDTDQDGKADKSIVFVQDKDLVSPLGIAVIGNKVYVSCSPNLIVYTDNDGDDKPDQKEIFLTGFGGKDHDHSLHAVVGGPDGKLYFNAGNAGPHIVTDKAGWTLRAGSVYTGGSPYATTNEVGLVSDDHRQWVGGIALRIDEQGKGLCVLGHNFRNSYEIFPDSRGDLWQNDNDDQVVTCRTTWLMEGGNAGYFSTDGSRYWQADQRPGQDIFRAHWHQDDPGVMPAGDRSGAGAPTGIVMNEGNSLGKHYLGLLLSADAGRNVIFGYRPKHSGSGIDLGDRVNFITSLASGDERYVWNDTAQESDNKKWFRPSDLVFGTEGALYVADWYDPVVGGHQMQDTVARGRIYRITPKGKVLKRPVFDLATMQGQIEAFKSPAVNVRFMASAKLRAARSQAVPFVRELLKDENQYVQARAIWLLSKLGEEGEKEVLRLLDDEDEAVRATAYRALRQTTMEILPLAHRMATDQSAFVRREVIVSLNNTAWEKTKSLLLSLADSLPVNDRWYLESLGSAFTGHEDEIYNELLKRMGAASLSSEQWSNKVARLIWRLHPKSSAKALAQRAASVTLTAYDREQALTALSFINTKEAAQAMNVLAKNPLPDVSEGATYWLAFRQSNDWYTLLDWKNTGVDTKYVRKVSAMKVRMGKILDEHMPLDERTWNTEAMAKDSVGGEMLLGMVSEGKLPKELYPVAERTIFENPNMSVRVQASLYFKKPGSSKNYSIPAIVKLPFHAAAGKAVFAQKCATCHRVKEMGHDVGPELTLIGKKFDRNALLDAVINPSAGLVFGYEAWTITTKEGESYFGFLVGDNKQNVVIKDLSGIKHAIPSSTIASRTRQEKSLMPEPSALGLSEQDLADISEFLLTLK